MGDMTAAHFIFIPGVLLVGVVIGWILGSRAAHDALGAELRRREERQKRDRLRDREEHFETPGGRGAAGSKNGATE